MDQPWIRKRFQDTSPVACPCGDAYRIITAEDNDLLGIHRVFIRGASTKHYHRKLTEYYIILDGEGEMELNDERITVSPGDVIMIPPGTSHALRGEFEIINVVSPPFDGKDEYPVE